MESRAVGITGGSVFQQLVEKDTENEDPPWDNLLPLANGTSLSWLKATSTVTRVGGCFPSFVHREPRHPSYSLL